MAQKKGPKYRTAAKFITKKVQYTSEMAKEQTEETQTTKARIKNQEDPHTPAKVQKENANKAKTKREAKVKKTELKLVKIN